MQRRKKRSTRRLQYRYTSIAATSAAGDSIHDSPLMLGGNGVVVQIDESLFRHKPKHHRGRATTNEVWVFGLCDTSQSPALGVMCIVPDRTAQTLLPIIRRHVRPGTEVHSDQWAAYNRVQQLQPVNNNQTLNHSLHFVDPATGVHKQHIESYWNRVKRRFKCMKGVHQTMRPCEALNNALSKTIPSSRC